MPSDKILPGSNGPFPLLEEQTTPDGQNVIQEGLEKKKNDLSNECKTSQYTLSYVFCKHTFIAGLVAFE